MEHVQGNAGRFLDALPLAVLLIHRNGLVTDGNARAVELLGFRKEATPAHWRSSIALPPSVAMEEALGNLLRSEKERTLLVESPFAHPIWAGRSLEISSCVANPREEAVIVFLREVAEVSHVTPVKGRREQVEAELRRERAWFEQLMNTLPDKIYFKDLQSRFLRISLRQALQFQLKSPAEAINKTDFDFFAESHARIAREEEERIISTGEPMVDKEEKLLLTDGTELWASSTKVPLRDPDNEVIGIVGISRDITARKRAEEALRRKNEEMQADLKMAYEVQKAFFTLDYPKFPNLARPGGKRIEFAHRYLPVATLGGDFFEIFQVSDDEAGVLICDVMGHGVRAALVTAFLRGLVGELKSLWREPGELLVEINRGLIPILRQSDSLMFVTIFYAVADVVREELRYANAGHPLPFVLRRREGKVERIQPASAGSEPAVGLIDGFAYSSAREPLARGDLTLFFTDGLFEVEDTLGDFFGEKGLGETLGKGLGLQAEELLDHVVNAAIKHAGKTAFTDDVCLVTVDFPGDPA